MADASTYPITQPFGYDPSYPLNGGYHRGVDYGCPVGTQVIVNNVVIGLSGATGAVTGAHLHVGKFVGGTAVDPGRAGFKFTNAVVLDTGYDSTNGNYVRINADGAVWVYLHLSVIKVSAGQVLKGGTVSKDAMTKDELTLLHRLALFADPGPAYLAAYTGKTFSQAADALRGDAPFNNSARKALDLKFEQLKAIPELKPGLYQVK